MSVELVNTNPEEVTDEHLQAVESALKHHSSKAETTITPLFKEGEEFVLKGCRFKFNKIAGALAVIEYIGLTEKAKKRNAKAVADNVRQRIRGR